MEYLTKCSRCSQQQHNDLTSQTSDTLVANISEILVELKEIRKLDVCSFWRKIRESRLLHQWVCLCKHHIRESAASRSVFIVERKYVFTLCIVLKDRSGVAVDTGIVRRMVIIVTMAKLA